jgi:hypothetical protein
MSKDSDRVLLIKPCTCKSDYMDKRYGAGMRVHTRGGKPGGKGGGSDKSNQFRCCGCGVVKTSVGIK